MKYGAKRRVYTLSGINPEVVSVAFGKCSRSPESFDEILKDLDQKKSSAFHKKYILGFGHKSVAEHAVISLALENVSILATKVIEDNRLASYTEKSTRYQQFDRDHYYKPKNIMNSNLKNIYLDAGNGLFDFYDKLTEKMFEFIEKKYPYTKELDQKAYKSKIKNRVFDNCRFLLPTATQTNLGMTVNARQLEHALNKMFSSPLDEIQDIANEIKKAGKKKLPTLLNDVSKNDYLSSSSSKLTKIAKDVLPVKGVAKNTTVALVDYDRKAEDKIIAALLYKYSHLPFKNILNVVKKLSKKQKETILSESFKGLKGTDWPLREFEHAYYTFEILLDYGAFRDIQRHRMCTQTNQLLTAEEGFAIPDEVIEAGFKKEYFEMMDRTAEAFKKIAKKYPHEAQYILPLATNKRTLFTWNFRELYHFIRLRTGSFGHSSYRVRAQEVYRELEKVQPALAKLIPVNML